MSRPNPEASQSAPYIVDLDPQAVPESATFLGQFAGTILQQAAPHSCFDLARKAAYAHPSAAKMLEGARNIDTGTFDNRLKLLEEEVASIPKAIARVVQDKGGIIVRTFEPFALDSPHLPMARLMERAGVVFEPPLPGRPALPFDGTAPPTSPEW